MDAPPPGYVALPPAANKRFQALTLAAFGRMEGETPVIGFRVAPHHNNSAGKCHGGMLMMFCDYFLPTIARLGDPEHDRFTPTISVSIDFLAPARLGDWVEGRGTVLRRSTNLVFVDGVASVAGQAVLRASGIFKRSGSDARRAGTADMLAAMRAAAQPSR